MVLEIVAIGLFSTFFVAVLTVTFNHFSIYEAVAKDFIRIIERSGRTRDKVSEVHWAMLYADDAGVVSLPDR